MLICVLLPMLDFLDVLWRAGELITQNHAIAMAATLPCGLLLAKLARDGSDHERVKQALAESEARFEVAFEYSSVGMGLLDLQGTWKRVNQRLAQIVGYRAEELLCHDLRSLAHPHDFAVFSPMFERLLAGELETFEMEMRLVHRDGRDVWLLVRAVSRRTTGGEPQEILIQAQDIVARRHAETQLRADVARLEAVIDAQKVIAVEDLDEHAMLSQVLARAQAMAGASGAVFEVVEGDQMVCRAVSGSVAGFLGLRLDKRSSLSGLCAATGETIICHDTEEDHRVDREACRKIGARSMVCVPIKGADVVGVLKVLAPHPHAFEAGHVRALLLFAWVVSWAVNRTSARAAQADQEQTRARLARIVESSQDAIYSVDHLGVITSWNAGAERLFGHCHGEAIGKPCKILVPEECNEEYAATGTRLRRGESVTLEEAVRLRKDGSRVEVNLSLTPFSATDGSPAGASIIAHDVSELNRTRRRLEASLAEKNVLLREVHHRVKNNLQVISSLLNLHSRHVDTDAARATLAEMQTRVRSMALVHRKLHGMADIARLDLTGYLRQLAAELTAAHQGGTGRIRVEVEGPEHTVPADTAVSCGLIATELLTNALKYAYPGDDGGSVRLSVFAGRELGFEVADEGAGFPPDLDPYDGSSLGLSLVRTLVKQLRGTLELRSSSQGVICRVGFPRED